MQGNGKKVRFTFFFDNTHFLFRTSQNNSFLTLVRPGVAIIGDEEFLNPVLDTDPQVEEWKALGIQPRSENEKLFTISMVDGRHRADVMLEKYKESLCVPVENRPSPRSLVIYARVLLQGSASDDEIQSYV